MASFALRVIYLIAALNVKSVLSATILALFSSLNYADHLIYRGYIELLAKQGHNVIMMTPFPGYLNYPEAEKVVELDVKEASAPFWDEYKRLTFKAYDYLEVIRELNELSVKVAVEQLRSQQMSSLLINPNVKFDLIITEADMPLLYAVADKYKAPHVAITAGHGKINMYESKGNPIHCLLYPDMFTLKYGNLTVWQKMQEIRRHLKYRYEYYYNYLPMCESLAKKMFSLKRSLIEVEYDIDMLFVSGTQMLIGNRPTVPAIIYVDRVHIRPGEPLPEVV